MQTRHCALCGPGPGKNVLYEANFSEQDFNASVFSARRLPDGIHGRLVRCETCGMVFTDPAVDSTALSKLYQQGLVHYGDLEGPIYDSYLPVLQEGLSRLGTRRESFLEIGGGTGFMLRFAAENGFARAVEIEPSQDAKSRFKPQLSSHTFICNIFERGTLPANSTSLACFFQMLDHVPNPKDFLAGVYDALEPGGVAVCVTHNTQAVSAKVLGERSPIYDIEHTYLFHPKNLQNLFEKAGFSNVKTRTLSNRYPLQYWFNLFPFPRFIKTLFNPVLKISGLGRIRLSLPAGNFSVIATK